MLTKRFGISSKFILAIAAIYSLLIILLSVSFHLILKENSILLRDILLANNKDLINIKSKAVIDKILDQKYKKIKELYEDLEKYCKQDSDILSVIIYTSTSDDNYFKVLNKITLNGPVIDLKKNKTVKENKEMNYLRKAMFGSIADPNIYLTNGFYYQIVYQPYKFEKKNLVIQFLISSSKINTALEQYDKSLYEIKKKIIILTGILILSVFVITFMMSYNFSILVKNLTQRLSQAAQGDEITLNEEADSELSELAISFNKVATGLKELKEKDKIIKELQGNNSFGDLFKYGVDLLKNSNIDDAVAIFKTLTIMKPDSFGSYFNLGIAYAKKKDYKNSLNMFERALQANPKHEVTRQYIDKVKRLVDNTNAVS